MHNTAKSVKSGTSLHTYAKEGVLTVSGASNFSNLPVRARFLVTGAIFN